MRYMLLALAVASACCLAEDTPGSIDKLKHRTMPLPNGKSIELVYIGESFFKLVTPEVLQGNTTDDVAFEARFQALTPDGHLKLAGSTGVVLASDPQVLRKAKELKSGDNISCFGTLRLASDGKSVELVLAEIFKEASDLQRFTRTYDELEKKSHAADLKNEAKDALAQAYVELGTRAVRTQATNKESTDNFGLAKLAKGAFTHGLDIQWQAVSALRPNDADSYYSLAYQYHELLPENSAQKYFKLIRLCLDLDTKHPAAVRVAPDLGLILFEDKWHTQSEIDDIVKGRKRDNEHKDKERAEYLLGLYKQIKSEGVLLAPHLSADIASGDAARAAAALKFYKNIVDDAPEYGVSVVTAMTEVDTPDALEALKIASRSPAEKIREVGYEALVWRSNRAQEREQTLSLLCDALKIEKESAAVKSGVDALVSLGGKPALGALICSLASENAEVRAAVMAGLKAATHESFSSPQEWESWWKENK